MSRENPFKRVQQARTPEEFIGASKDEVLRAGEGAAPAPVTEPVVAAPAPAPAAVEEGVRRDDGSLASQIPIPVNFKLNESVYWEIKHAVRRMPKMSLRQFLEDAAIEKLARLKKKS
jgi:hypothetical protein